MLLKQIMYITGIDKTVPGDTYFLEFDEKMFVRERNQKMDGKIPYTYIAYTKRG